VTDASAAMNLNLICGVTVPGLGIEGEGGRIRAV
jgi:hypothetical protein